ncbi:guanylin family protein [Takifugu flavidus]|uniref:Guanylate cyclase activator 2B n=1 Tax=Takifugu flavidus TaxID=433684 RepID=A0A5C6N629_9TELE|nr:guanylin family protein [Takifugu flavidus]TWW62776.1 Guanylin Guanylate cyclase activator 2A [Takifugu flavidus]
MWTEVKGTASRARRQTQTGSPPAETSVDMKATFVTTALLVLALSWTGSGAVEVEENGLTFSFEAVKRLQELVQGSGLMGSTSPRLRASAGSPCADPLLPQEFLPVCRQRGASASLTRLAMVPLDLCEICAFAACTGC